MDVNTLKIKIKPKVSTDSESLLHFTNKSTTQRNYMSQFDNFLAAQEELFGDLVQAVVVSKNKR